MELFWKAIAVSLLTVILGAVMGKKDKDISVLLSIAGCVLIAGFTAVYLSPVVRFLGELESMGNLRSDLLGILLKAVGIGLISEIAAVVCSDSGNAGLGKMIQLIGSVVILWLSIPVFQALLDLVQTILGEL